MKTIAKLLALSFAIGSLFALSGCNTVKGVGQDVQKAGSAIENAAEKKK
jgi:predicted small secreted protein